MEWWSRSRGRIQLQTGIPRGKPLPIDCVRQGHLSSRVCRSGEQEVRIRKDINLWILGFPRYALDSRIRNMLAWVEPPSRDQYCFPDGILLITKSCTCELNQRNLLCSMLMVNSTYQLSIDCNHLTHHSYSDTSLIIKTDNFPAQTLR